MKASEILRKLADVIDHQDAGEEVRPNRAVLTPAEPESGESEHINTKSMVAPLQQKLELLKKGVGMDNAFDNGKIQNDTESCHDCGCSPCECEHSDSDLETLKRNAGIAPVVIQIASDDEPLDM